MYTAQGTLSRESVIAQYGPMVRRVAGQMIARLPANVEMDDLVQAGMIGLFDALGRYEANMGAQFETFAMQRVRGAMLDELRGADWLPRSVRKNQRSIEKAIHKLEQSLGRPPTESEIAADLGMSLPDYQQMLADTRGGQLIYLEDAGDREGDDDYLDRHVHASEPDPLETLRDRRFRTALVAAIKDLPEREQLVMSLYYEQDLHLREIGEVLGVTESRVSQLHSQAVARLRTKLKAWI